MAAWITKEQILNIIAECRSFRELVIKLGRKPVGGNIVQMQARCTKFKIDTSHFLGKSSALGQVSSKRKTAEELLVLGKPEDGRREASKLRRCLEELGVKYKCAICNANEWQGQPITLDIDHIDGCYWNNVRENLRFLCPNCHRQTPTYGSKKRYAPVT